MIFTTRHRSFFLAILMAALCGHTAAGQADKARDDGDLQAVIVVMRHGVRAPIESETRSSAYNAQAWPAWPTPPGVLTPHGTEALRLLGEFYRSRYSPLLQDDSCKHPRLYIEANSTQRTIASAKAILSGLSPRCRVEVHSARDSFNPLFSPSRSGAVDQQLIKAATLGRMADQPQWFTNAFARPLEKLHRILIDCQGPGCNRSVPDFRSVRVQKGIAASRDASVESPVALGADFAENFLLQYTEGMPMSQVGWGRVSRADLDDLMQMNTQYHDFMLRTPYEAQVAASDLAAHIRDTILGISSSRPTPHELGTTEDRFILLDGHDSNLSWLGGLLHLDWLLPDQTFNATPPGSALVFEIRRNRSSHRSTVQVLFISQTLDQIRNLRHLTGAEHPSVAPVFVPGCGNSAPGYACTVEGLSKVIDSAIDPRFVTQSAR
ncbi:MAG TPA: histidine-type phosphatase [Edaphobacter sp.]|nr:histidine-type phosphatase [Edaphobacter sp.]